MDTEILLISVKKILEKYERLPDDVDWVIESLVNEIAEEISNSMQPGDNFSDIVDFMDEVDLGKWKNVKFKDII